MAKLDRETRAILRSIEKWIGIATGNNADRGEQNCALCQEFRVGRREPEYCVGCPVYQRTGQKGCNGTPYVPFKNTATIVSEDGSFHRVADTYASRKAAVDEVVFLASLLSCDDNSKDWCDRIKAHSDKFIDEMDHRWSRPEYSYEMTETTTTINEKPQTAYDLSKARLRIRRMSRHLENVDRNLDQLNSRVANLELEEYRSKSHAETASKTVVGVSGKEFSAEDMWINVWVTPTRKLVSDGRTYTTESDARKQLVRDRKNMRKKGVTDLRVYIDTYRASMLDMLSVEDLEYVQRAL